MAELRLPAEADVAEALRRRPPARWDVRGREVGAVAVPVQGGVLWCIKRAENLKHHPRELGFPGGRPDPGDASLAAAALRELYEEIGVDPAHVRVLGELDPVPTATSRFALHPFCVAVDAGIEPMPAPAEVAALIRAPWEDFFEGRVGYRALDLGAYTSPIFDFAEGSMYGASAHILLEVLELYGALMEMRLPEPEPATEIPWQ